MDDAASPEGPTPTVADQLRALVAAEGYRPRRRVVEEDPWTVHFEAEGRVYYALCSRDDPDYIAFFTGFRLDGMAKDELTLLRVANAVQSEMKIVKIQVPPTQRFVEMQLGLFLYGRPVSADLLERCIGTLRATCIAFQDRALAVLLPRGRA